MPLSYEIQYGFVGPDAVMRAADILGLKIYDYNDKLMDSVETLKATLEDDSPGKASWGMYIPDNLIDPIDKSLSQAYKATLNRIGWPFTKSGKEKRYFLVETPWGDRESVAWRIDLMYDPIDTGDSPDDISLGINFSSRYFPTLLDMESLYGVLPNAFRPDLKQEMWMEIAEEEILKEIPKLKDLNIGRFFRMKFY